MKYGTIEDAYFFVSSARYGEHSAVLRRDTGQVYYRSEMADLDEIADADLRSGHCIEIPHRNDLGLGHDLVFAFIEDGLPEHYERVRRFFRRPGAYARFKTLLASMGLLQLWYDFEAQREAAALRQWCADSDIELEDQVGSRKCAPLCSLVEYTPG